MSFQAYLDNIKAKTGKTPEDFAKLAAKKGWATHGEIVAWLKSDFALGHEHATAIDGVLLTSGAPKASPAQKMDDLFSGKKAEWRKACDTLIAQITKFGPDVLVEANHTYVNLLRSTRKFGILQPSSADRLDIGIKRKGKDSGGRFETAGKWNSMVTHRVRVANPKEIDAEVLSWLKSAYEAA